MASMSSLATALSGLRTAQAGLYTTGHNLSNVNTPGYTRQRVDQTSASYSVVGYNGKDFLSVGLGADVSQIQQIRDMFLDKNYRTEASRVNFYDLRLAVTDEIASIFGEIQGDSKMSKMIDSMWKSLQELSDHPSGIEARTLFISNATKFLDKANEIRANMVKYQNLLNSEVKSQVQRMNQIGVQLGELSHQIGLYESSGDHANDLRDERNLLLDELSGIVEIDYYEDINKTMHVSIEGNVFVSGTYVNKIGLRYTSDKYPFVEPVFTSDDNILEFGDAGRPLFDDLDKVVNAQRQNDRGYLKSLLLARGKEPANYLTHEGEVENYIIPKAMREFDILVNKVVTLINDTFAPMYDNDTGDTVDINGNIITRPKDLNGSSGVEVFKRKYVERFEYDDDGNIIKYNGEDPNDINTLYTAGNIEINKDLKNDWNKLATSVTGDRDDNSLIEGILQMWKNVSWVDSETNMVIRNPYAPKLNTLADPLAFDAFYNMSTTRMGQIGSEAKTFLDSESELLNKITNDRLSLSGVSMDEEMSAMMKYQHAFNAASRVVNEVNDMIDRIVNKLGRVGL